MEKAAERSEEKQGSESFLMASGCTKDESSALEACPWALCEHTVSVGGE